MSRRPPRPEDVEADIRTALVNKTGLGRDGWALEEVAVNATPGTHRYVFQATHPVGERSLAVKWCEVASQAQDEWAGLEALGRGAAPLVAPVFLDGRVLATAWLAAPRADTLLLRASEGQRAMCLRQAGQWLASLHAGGLRRRMVRDFRNLCGRLRTRFGSARSLEADRLLDALDQRASGIGRVERAGVPLHWDFKPRNLFVTERGIVGFDVGPIKPGLALHDAVSFLTAMELDRYEAEALGTRQAGTVEADRRAFFAGYGALDAGDVPLLDMIEDQLLVARWLRHSTIADPPFERVAATTQVLAARGLPEPTGVMRPGRLVRRRLLRPRWSDRIAT